MNNPSMLRRLLFTVPLIALYIAFIPARAAAQDADLSVVKSGPSTAAAGTDIQYDISVNNFSGQESTPNNVLTDVLPAGLTFVSETHSDPWTCTTPAVGSGGTITCTNTNPIPDEGTAIFSFVVHIAPNVPVGTMISNTATISHGGEDSNPNNNSSMFVTTVGQPPPPPPPPLNPHDVLISEFRLSGPGGPSDEYIELYCNRNIDCDLSGATIRNYNNALPGDAGPGDLSATFPGQTIIPAHQYLLLGDESAGQYTLGKYGAIDVDLHNAQVPDYFNDNEGFQLLSAGDDPLVVDSVGFTGGGEDVNFVEGTGLQRATAARPGFQYAYVRKRTTATDGLPQDTDNNADDFVLVSISGTPHPGITAPPVLGAPGPQGLSSPLSYNNSQVTWSYVEPNVDRHSSPNLVRTGSGNNGTISFRRSFTNNTNQSFDYIAFRVVEITTLNSPNPQGDNAQLRLLTSPNAESFTNSQGRPVNIQGTTLEYDPGCGCEPAQPAGGGLNSSVSITEIRINPGDTIDVQFLLNVDKAGQYRFYVYVEAFPALQECNACPVPGAPAKSRLSVSVTPRVPRKMINFKSTPKSANQKPKRSGAVPTKSFGGSVVTPSAIPNAAPARILILNPSVTTTTPNRRRRKSRLRHKSSAALRAKAERRSGEEKQQQ